MIHKYTGNSDTNAQLGSVISTLPDVRMFGGGPDPSRFLYCLIRAEDGAASKLLLRSVHYDIGELKPGERKTPLTIMYGQIPEVVYDEIGLAAIKYGTHIKIGLEDRGTLIVVGCWKNIWVRTDSAYRCKQHHYGIPGIRPNFNDVAMLLNKEFKDYTIMHYVSEQTV
ncbi:MAG: hypothetical protein ACREBH_01295 [Candidatus Micrarchaeaceae archaeon]